MLAVLRPAQCLAAESNISRVRPTQPLESDLEISKGDGEEGCPGNAWPQVNMQAIEGDLTGGSDITTQHLQSPAPTHTPNVMCCHHFDNWQYSTCIRHALDLFD